MERDYKKLYEQALEKARISRLQLLDIGEEATEIEHIFPELKESEDDEVLNNIITAFKRIGENCEHYFSPDTAKVFEKTLKSLKDKIHPKSEWSDEDEKMKSLIISTLTSMGTLNLERYYHMNLDEVKNWFKFIKDRVQPKQEWSEKDEQMLTLIIDEMEAIKSNSSTIFEKNIAQEKIDWLKSIKPQQNQYDKGFNDGFSASEHNIKMTEEDIVHINNIIGCLEEFIRPGFPIYKGGVVKEIKWLENLKNNK